MRRLLSRPLTGWGRTLSLTILVATLGSLWPASAAETVTEKVSVAAAEAKVAVQETSQAAQSKMQELWRRIDDARLKNRTPDQLAGWIIMGLLVGGLISKFTRLSQLTTLLLGLVGAFIGGIIANVIQLDLGMGPVLIRYEELFASLLGGVAILILARALLARKPEKK
jgi:uncharacterized membrane protein YeaQ/YmgE (transglycosylase-associated protein family)